ncbi:MAG: helix-turn-helix domain-containing protein, partial [Solirubrobacteraceae bacterium]
MQGVVLVAAGKGLSAREIAERVGCSQKRAGRWRGRWERDGIGRVA